MCVGGLSIARGDSCRLAGRLLHSRGQALHLVNREGSDLPVGMATAQLGWAPLGMRGGEPPPRRRASRLLHSWGGRLLVCGEVSHLPVGAHAQPAGCRVVHFGLVPF